MIIESEQKVEFVSLKKRSKEEVEAILREYAGGAGILELAKKYEMSETTFYRILGLSRGAVPKDKKRESRIKKLEKTLAQRDKEISLLKAVLKKS